MVYGMKGENTPIIVANEHWPLPKNLINWVKEERMVNSFIDFIHPLTPEESVGFAECCAYIYPAVQEAPLREDVVEIYLYCFNQVLKGKKIEVPEELIVDELTEYEFQKLKEFKLWIYKQRGGKEKNPIINVLRDVFKEIPKQKLSNEN